MRVCDWIAEYLYINGVKNVHGLMGGGASGLNDGFIKNGKLNYICYHHEQGAAHAAIGESRYTGNISIVNPTTGCAGTNCATSVLNAWQDGVPVLFISGNVKLNTCSGWINQNKKINLRKYGIQEHHIVDTYKTITKAAIFVTHAEDIPYFLQYVMYLATSGRPGPVWLDIPGDIQVAQMPKEYTSFVPPVLESTSFDPAALKTYLNAAERPIVLAGQGIRQANCVDKFIQFVEKYQLPFVSTYGARDYIEDTHELNLGAIGIKGSRYGNFAMQNADLLLVLGSSLNSSVIGYDPLQFSIGSKKIIVDCDEDELNKDILDIEQKYKVDLKYFFKGMYE
jgi:acetolactate synthase-1/2/3 large subunit